MSNRQARREQSRGARQQQQRASRPSRQPQGPKRGGGSNLPDFMSPGFLIIAALVVIGLAALLVFAIMNSGGSDEGAVQQLEEASANLPVDLADGKALGREDAPVTLTEYADFQCPFCLKYSAESEPMIIDEYVKTGKVRLEYKHLPILGQESARAAVASECAAEQNKFWQYREKLFLVQAEAGQLSNERTNVGRFDDESLREYAQEVGLDMNAFNSCLNDPATTDKVTADNREASQLGVNSTPSFFLNGRPLGGTPIDEDAWREVLDQVIAEAQASPTAAGSATATTTGTGSPAASPSPAATGSPAASATGTAAR